MLDVHPPHEAAHTWKDFFIHIATICVGLLIAIGLEQTVEAIHHHHQREYLEEQMHAECEHNILLIQEQLRFIAASITYGKRCEQALDAAPADGGMFTVTLPAFQAPALPAGILISPSRGTWTVAKAAGTVALLPPETAKLYARLDLAAEFEQTDEYAVGQKLNQWRSAMQLSHIPEDVAVTSRVTAAQRSELLLAAIQLRQASEAFRFRLAVEQGAAQAIVDHVGSLEQMYLYQDRAVLAASAQ